MASDTSRVSSEEEQDVIQTVDEELTRIVSLKKQAEVLGLSSDKIQAYVENALERERRAAERELEREREERERELEREREERERKLEREERERKLEHEERKLEREERMELERLKLELEKEKLRAEVEMAGKEHLDHATSQHTHRSPFNPPKLPLFKEDRDDIDSFIYRFEAHAKLCKWDKDSWPVHFSACLQGVPLTFFHSLCASGSVEYEEMKKHFLRRFQCTEDGFRERFRSAKPEKDESFQSYFLRIAHYFDRWVELSGITDLRDLMLKEQLIFSVTKDLSVFLKEREFGTLQELTEAADRYREAHPGKSMARVREASLFASSVAQGVPRQSVPFPSFRGSPQGARNLRPSGRGTFPNHRGSQSFQAFQNTSSDYRKTAFFSPQQSHVPFRGGYNQRGGHNSRRAPGASDICRKCGGMGHWSAQCPSSNKVHPAAACRVLVSSNAERLQGNLKLFSGNVNGLSASVLRDTGCTTAGVRSSMVADSQRTGEMQRCISFGGTIETFPLAVVPVDTPFFSGDLLCCVIDDPVADLIIGNLPEVSDTPLGCASEKSLQAAAVTTRLQEKQKKRSLEALSTPLLSDLDVDRDKLSSLQKEDPSLADLFVQAEKQTMSTVGKASVSFEVRDTVLYRVFKDSKEDTIQVVVPKVLRNTVLATAHDGIMAGHCGVRRTLQRVLLRFFWPFVRRDVRMYCKTCDVCQKTLAKGRVHPVPLEKMPVVDVPFKRLAIDLIGPFKPTSRNGFRYVLTVIDVATRFPEAIPLRNIDTISVAEALVSVFSRVGCPEEILSDCGTQFVSDLMMEVYRLMSIKSIHTSPYHPQGNGLVERFNGTLKTMLKKVVHSQPDQWDRYIPALLFAYRELPSESTGFSPFELVFGRRPRGPIDLLARSWTGDKEDDQAKPLYQYVFDLKNILTESITVATKSIQEASEKHKHSFDKKAVPRSFAVGDEVLVLLPSDSNKLLMQWKGPFPVVECFGCDYKVQMGSKIKVFHANMLLKYHRRKREDAVSVALVQNDHLPPCDQGEIDDTLFPFNTLDPQEFSDRDDCVQSAQVAVIQSEDDDDVKLLSLPSITGESVRDIHIDNRLSDKQNKQMTDIFVKFEDIFTDKPGIARCGLEHEINLTSDVPVRLKPYPLPFASREVVEKEVQTMLDLGVIEPSQSPYCSPIVLVKKKDGSTRFCIDFRVLNKKTVFDAEPIPDVEELFCSLSGGRYFTKIDLAKGYWQIPVRECDRAKTAFQTPLGLFQWTRMPFGLVTAPATFARMMRALSLHTFSSISFFDDILISSATWDTHLRHIEGVLKTISNCGLTIRPSKMCAGFRELDFLGHVISEGTLKPQQDKIKKILQVTKPATKKQVRSLLGLIGYYRRFIPNFATLAAPLSDLLRSSSVKNITWTPECDSSFKKIQEFLTFAPILKLPNLAQGFVLRTDASSAGIGAVLFQEVEGILHPVSYVSRKLLDREKRYSTIERECLAIVWAVNKLSRYLWGREFTLQTDHKPLTFMNSGKFQNGRLIRWILSLQEFMFRVEPVSGTDNVLADTLSRVAVDQQLP